MISAKASAASSIFSALVARDGVNALPVVEHEAELLSAEGTYPYGALGAAANAAAMKNWRSNRDRAVSLIQATFERAFARYRDRPASYSEDYAFGDMLIHLGGSLPNEVLRHALDLLVQNLLMTDTKAYQVQAQMFACDGREVKADNAIDAVQSLGTCGKITVQSRAKSAQAQVAQRRALLEQAKLNLSYCTIVSTVWMPRVKFL